MFQSYCRISDVKRSRVAGGGGEAGVILWPEGVDNGEGMTGARPGNVNGHEFWREARLSGHQACEGGVCACVSIWGSVGMFLNASVRNPNPPEAVLTVGVCYFLLQEVRRSPEPRLSLLISLRTQTLFSGLPCCTFALLASSGQKMVTAAQAIMCPHRQSPKAR